MKVTLKNFLSYEDETIDFGQGKTSLIVGRNGHGKSAALESVVFCLYGDGRGGSNSDFARISGDGSFSVEFVDAPDGDRELTIFRGWDGRKGVFTVSGDGVNLKGSEAQEFVDGVYGTVSDFLLTKFYGLSGKKVSRNPLTALPSEQIDMLQTMAQTQDYPVFLDRVKSMKKQTEQTISKIETVIETRVPESVEALKKTLSENETKKASVERRLSKIREKRAELDQTEERFRNLSSRREIAYRALENLKESLSDIDSDIESEESSERQTLNYIKQAKVTLADIADRKGELKGKEELQEELQGVRDEKSKIEAHVSLLGAATKATGGHGHQCPLCESEVGEDRVAGWAADIEESESKARKLGEIEAALVTELQEAVNIENNEKRSESRIRELNERLAKISNRVQDLKTKRRSIHQKIESSNEEVADLTAKLSSQDFDGFREKISELDSKNSELSTEMGELVAEIRSIDRRIKESREISKKNEESAAALEEHKFRLQALDVLSDAYSRYGIPFELMQRLVSAIEEIATSVYQEFDGGAQIVIQIDSDSKRPGVRFMLQDVSGLKDYRLLSMGQQAMYYLAFRVAVNKIISISKNLQGDFIVLDEVAANLDPENVSNLIRVMESTVRKWFSTVIMVSHVPVPNVFDNQIRVEMDDSGVSRVSFL